jgi:hypothetical protein
MARRHASTEKASVVAHSVIAETEGVVEVGVPSKDGPAIDGTLADELVGVLTPSQTISDGQQRSREQKAPP